MSGLLGTIASGLGFLNALLGGAGSGRMVLVPITDDNGAQVLNTEGDPSYQFFDSYVALREEHADEVQIADHPLAVGSVISDHAFDLPARLQMTMGWSPSAIGLTSTFSALGITLPTLTGFLPGAGAIGAAKISEIYQRILQVKKDKKLLTIFTGKRAYNNMLISLITEETTVETENVLVLHITFREILLAQVVTTTNSPVSAQPGAQATPESSTPTTAGGPKQAVPTQNASGGVLV